MCLGSKPEYHHHLDHIVSYAKAYGVPLLSLSSRVCIMGDIVAMEYNYHSDCRGFYIDFLYEWERICVAFITIFSMAVCFTIYQQCHSCCQHYVSQWSWMCLSNKQELCYHLAHIVSSSEMFVAPLLGLLSRVRITDHILAKPYNYHSDCRVSCMDFLYETNWRKFVWFW